MLLVGGDTPKTSPPNRWWLWLWFRQTSLPGLGKIHFQDMSPLYHRLWGLHSESSCGLWADDEDLMTKTCRRDHSRPLEQFGLAAVDRSGHCSVIHWGLEHGWGVPM